ncbi:MAG: PBSX family phage terminase large subunit [Flammeovirgaceae bacterium]|nr:PBSX family phage terminase large subunit [Flammeovirgaceae bacterium]
MSFRLPRILNLPDKISPIVDRFNDYRYFLLEGGRGGGKSQGIGRFLLYAGARYKLRIVCGRETQASIDESVYSLMVDLIRTYQLNYTMYKTRLVHNHSGTTINFRGFREQGAFNIQGMEGVDIVWIDESQAITKQTLDVLIPTIRKERAKIYFSMNRHKHNDPAFTRFYSRDDCFHINVNYFDNPFCTSALKKEADECKKVSDKDYNHIWLGYPLDQTEDALFSVSELQSAKEAVYLLRQGYGYRIGGFDIARYGDDKCACIGLQQQSALHWKTHFVDQWEKKDLNYTTGRILTTSMEQRFNDNVIDEDGIGAGPLDTLNKGRGLESFRGFRNPRLSYKEDKDYGNVRTKFAYRVKDMILKGHLHITDDELIEEMLTLRYTFDHNQRRILISKEKQRKDGIKSQNLFDALLMGVSRIGDYIEQHDESNYINQPQFSKESDIMSGAGIR